MFTDSNIMKRLANDGLLKEELFELIFKVAKQTIGFDLSQYQKPIDPPDHMIIDYFDLIK